MKQSSCDVFEVRGLAAITRILGERVNEPVAYTPQTVQVMRVYVNTLQKILADMEAKQGADTDPMSDIERMDRWFMTGFDNLLQYLDDRIKDGPPMAQQHRAHLERSMDVAICKIRNSPTSEASDESGTA